MLSKIAIEEQIANEMYTLYRNAASTFEVDNLLKEFGATIRMYTSNDADGTDPEEFNYKIAMTLHETSIALHKEAMTRLTSSHSPATIESSNTTTTTQENIMNSTINIESMTIEQLAALQLKIAQRINDLLMIEVNPHKECDIPQEKLEDVVVPQAAPKATRVKKSKENDEARLARRIESDKIITRNTGIAKPDMEKVAQVAAAMEKTDEKVRKAIAAKATSEPAASTSDVSTMKYAELRSFISKATKACDGAKAQAQSIARKYGAKSWATVGRQGYEEIYQLIKA